MKHPEKLKKLGLLFDNLRGEIIRNADIHYCW